MEEDLWRRRREIHPVGGELILHRGQYRVSGVQSIRAPRRCANQRARKLIDEGAKSISITCIHHDCIREELGVGDHFMSDPYAHNMTSQYGAVLGKFVDRAETLVHRLGQVNARERRYRACDAMAVASTTHSEFGDVNPAQPPSPVRRSSVRRVSRPRGVGECGSPFPHPGFQLAAQAGYNCHRPGDAGDGRVGHCAGNPGGVDGVVAIE